MIKLDKIAKYNDEIYSGSPQTRNTGATEYQSNADPQKEWQSQNSNLTLSDRDSDTRSTALMGQMNNMEHNINMFLNNAKLNNAQRNEHCRDEKSSWYVGAYFSISQTTSCSQGSANRQRSRTTT